MTVLETAELPLLRVLGPEVAEVFAALHREHGVDLRFGVQVAEITGSGRPGRRRAARRRQPRPGRRCRGRHRDHAQRRARRAGGPRGRQRRPVDAGLRSSDPDIYAAGDVANAFHPLLGKHIRVEHWANALNQPPAAARAMLGQDVSYDRVPYFFTDQYDLGMEYSGYVEPDGYDEVVFRGDVPGREFVAFWLDGGGRVLAGMNVNVWDVNDQIQALVRAARPVDVAALTDPDGRWTRSLLPERDGARGPVSHQHVDVRAG